MNKLTFSGHESFTCKQFWLKKGFDFLKEGKRFSEKTAVVDLGVGKNMVRSIRFWLKAFEVADETNSNSTSELGEYLFGEKGKDPFLEDIGSVWLLHYHLIKSGNASIYNLVFNEFRKTRNEFHLEQLHNFLKQKCTEAESNTYNENTINRDIRVFLANYAKPKRKRAQVEEAYSSLLHELNLLNHTRKDSISGDGYLDFYSIQSDEKSDLPYQLVLYAILDNERFGKTISFKDLQLVENSPGRIFAINAEGLLKKVQAISEAYKGITYSETAGNQQFQIASELNKWEILNDYFNN